jgi:hypothetical protein
MIGSAAGFCQKHKIDKMFVGLEDATEPTCVRCVADATPKLGRDQKVEDPGEGFFHGKGSSANITVTESAHGAVAGPVAPIVKATSLEAHINHAISWLTTAPMPKDLKQFKSLQKSIAILQGLLENKNG